MQYDPNQDLREQIAQFSDDALDSTVTEEATNMANATNSEGIGAQIDFLNLQRGYTDEQIFNVAAGICTETSEED
jgi:hypothetical protein